MKSSQIVETRKWKRPPIIERSTERDHSIGTNLDGTYICTYTLGDYNAYINICHTYVRTVLNPQKNI